MMLWRLLRPHNPSKRSWGRFLRCNDGDGLLRVIGGGAAVETRCVDRLIRKGHACGGIFASDLDKQLVFGDIAGRYVVAVAGFGELVGSVVVPGQ